MLIVTNESALGVGRQCGLASTGQTEEDGNVAVLTLVGRRVKSKDVVLDGHLVEKNGENSLFHFSRVLGTEDDHLLGSKVDGDGCRRAHASGVPVGREPTTIVNDIVGVEGLQLLPRGTDEHVAHEQSMVSAGAHNADTDAVTLVPAGVSINDINAVPCVEVIDGTFSVDSPDL